MKLWSVNLPEEPDSVELLPVPSQKVGKQTVHRLKKEALQEFKIVGQSIADSIYLKEWSGTAEEHAKFLAENKEWWREATFLSGVSE